MSVAVACMAPIISARRVANSFVVMVFLLSLAASSRPASNRSCA
ncbi:hypothetical protein OCAR_4022 [Afipia carboxidovorans OM5]|nr:hypothetical protein OCAR_4022 [Afipia carboxidovorans OM5]